jgi:ABC-type nitrate/sulfonate/bicarbonate transport system substrate-binding protein
MVGIAALGALALGATGAGAAPPGAAGAAAPGGLPQAQRVVVTSPSTGLFEMGFVVALRRGFYAEGGLDVTRVQMAPSVSVAAVLAGEGDYTLSAGSTVTAIVGSDAPLKLVLGMAVRALHVLMTNDPAIQSVADLRGRAIATSTLTDTTANLVRYALRARGLEPQVDVALQPLGESPNRLAALQGGQVNAVILDLAQAVEAERRGGRVLLRPAELPDLPISALSVTETKLRDQTPQVEAMIRASLRGLRFLRDNRADTVAIMMEHLGLSRDVAETTYDLGAGSFAADGIIPESGLQMLLETSRDAAGRDSAATAAQIADFSLARRIGQQQ